MSSLLATISNSASRPGFLAVHIGQETQGSRPEPFENSQEFSRRVPQRPLFRIWPGLPCQIVPLLRLRSDPSARRRQILSDSPSYSRVTHEPDTFAQVRTGLLSRTSPAGSLRNSATLSYAACAPSIVATHRSKKRCPASARARVRVVRCCRRTPSRFSSAATRRLSQRRLRVRLRKIRHIGRPKQRSICRLDLLLLLVRTNPLQVGFALPLHQYARKRSSPGPRPKRRLAAMGRDWPYKATNRQHGWLKMERTAAANPAWAGFTVRRRPPVRVEAVCATPCPRLRRIAPGRYWLTTIA